MSLPHPSIVHKKYSQILDTEYRLLWCIQHCPHRHHACRYDCPIWQFKNWLKKQ